MQKLLEAIQEVSASIGELPDSITVDLHVDSYNLIASIYEEQNRIADALERIATALEAK